jgi:hypothetical protein
MNPRKPNNFRIKRACPFYFREDVFFWNGNSLEELPIINNHLSIINNKGEVFLVRRSLGEGGFRNAMKKSRSLFGRLNNEVRRNSADKATAFHRSSLREKALPQNACRPKNSVNLCESVSNFPSCLSVFACPVGGWNSTCRGEAFLSRHRH